MFAHLLNIQRVDVLSGGLIQPVNTLGCVVQLPGVEKLSSAGITVSVLRDVIGPAALPTGKEQA